MIEDTRPGHTIEPDATFDLSGYGGRVIPKSKAELLRPMWNEFRATLTADIIVFPLDAAPIEGLDDDGLPFKVCPQCGEIFYKVLNRSWANWAVQRYCSKHCAEQAQVRKTQSKNCVVCGKEFARRENEELENYRNRKTCSTECGNVLRRENITGWRKKDGLKKAG